MRNEIKEKYREKIMTLIRDNDIYDFFIFDKDLKYVIVCNDIFFLASADAEIVEYEDVELLKQSFEEINKLNHNSTMPEYDALILFCIKKRKLLPHEKILNNTDKNIVDLFIKNSKSA